MVIEQLDSIVEGIFFWGGLVVLILSLLFLASVEVNRRGVLQSKGGMRSFQSDKAVGTAMMTSVLSVISMTASWKAISVLWGLLASAVFIVFMFAIDDAYRRAFEKTVGSKLKNFMNRFEAIFQGKHRKE